MTDPLDFNFFPEDADTWDEVDRAFREQHPNARYVVLEMADLTDLIELIATLQAHPDSPLLVPVYEYPVHAKAVAVLDEWHGTDRKES